MPHVRRKANKDFPARIKTEMDEAVSRCKKKKAAIPEKMARLLGHLSIRIALR
jgi:hypothetical protein